MNDSAELGQALEMARQTIASMVGGGAPQYASISDQMIETIKLLEKLSVFVCCFSTDEDDLTQWRGYSGGSNGFSIGFSTKALIALTEDHPFRIGPCIYHVGDQRQIIREAIDHHAEHSGSLPSREFKGEFARTLVECSAFFKHPSFEPEKEWRLVSRHTLTPHAHIDFRAGRSMLIPHYRFPIWYNESPTIESLMVGPSPNMELSVEAGAMLMKQHRIPVAVDKSETPYRDW